MSRIIMSAGRAPLAPSAIALALAIAANPAAAREAPSRPDALAHPRPAQGDEITVTGHPPMDYAILASTRTLESDSLVAAARGQIGETLSRLPGVSATSFAPGASRPVLRGMDGDRIRVLVDGIGSIDAASVSADHAVVLDPLTTDHIDVIHGPAVLMFGGQAIGGAVNALDRRIPREVPDDVHGEATGGHGTAANERHLGGAVRLRLADRLAASLDASWRTSSDLGVGGPVNARPLRAELLAQADELRAAGEPGEAAETVRQANQSGRVPNTAARATTFGAGLAFIDAGGNLGLSVQRHDTRYGVPMRPGAGHGHGEAGADDSQAHGVAPVAIDLAQTRIDLRGAIAIDGFLDSLQVRGAYGHYRHIEYEGAQAGTRFAARGFEARADLVQSRRGAWRGRSGLQVQARRMTVTGAEAFVPGNDVSRIGLFTIQSLRLGRFEIEAAGRYEHARIKRIDNAFNRAFGLWSGAAGLAWTPSAAVKLGASYIRGARAPAPEELLADGLHAASQSQELGDPALGAETSDGIEAWLRYRSGGAEVSVTAFTTSFAGFISAMPDAAGREGFPVFRYVQGGARFRGIEASASLEALRRGSVGLTFDLSADHTRAAIRATGPAPRIPPLRLRAGAQALLDDLRLRAEVEWNDRQARVARFEHPVPAFTLVNLSADWHPFGEEGPLTLVASADNLFDVIGRRAASLTREFVPVAGRDIRLAARFSF